MPQPRDEEKQTPTPKASGPAPSFPALCASLPYLPCLFTCRVRHYQQSIGWAEETGTLAVLRDVMLRAPMSERLAFAVAGGFVSPCVRELARFLADKKTRSRHLGGRCRSSRRVISPANVCVFPRLVIVLRPWARDGLELELELELELVRRAREPQ